MIKPLHDGRSFRQKALGLILISFLFSACPFSRAQEGFGQFEAISREVTVFNLGKHEFSPDAIARELSVFNLGPTPPFSTDGISRELSAFARPGEPPSPFVSGPPGPIVELGTRVVLSVSATGTAPFQFQWRFNGQNIPGATSPAYVIPSMRLADAGTYRCVVINAYGGAYSDRIELQVPMENLWLADQFAERPAFSDFSRQGTTNNLAAAIEEFEPEHAGKPGGHSLWMTWRAPATGVATFSTVGSNFDTLLAVYTGAALADLAPVASDEDSGGFFRSALSFNAIAGAEYHVAVDGFAGAAGRVVLSWDLQAGVPNFPRIIEAPQSRTVTPGSSTTLRVVVESTGPVTYRWLLNDVAIPGANGDVLNLQNITALNIGTYRAEVSSGTFSILSEPAVVELSGVAQAQTQDKFQDLFAVPGMGAAPARQAASSFPIVTAGFAGSQNINNFGATTELGEPIHAGVPNGASRWFILTAGDDGTFVIDTIGSDIDTILAVYTGTDLFNLQLVASDNNGAPDGLRSYVRFQATSRTSYLIAAGGHNNAQGNILLNWKLGRPARILSAPLSQAVCIGDLVTLSSAASGIPVPKYQWYLNGVAQRFQASATLERPEIRDEQLGTYTVVVSNDFGSDSAQAIVSVMPCQLLRFDPAVPPRIVDGNFELQIIGSESGKQILIQSSIDLKQWDTVFTTASGGATKFSEKVEGSARFYRAIEQ